MKWLPLFGLVLFLTACSSSEKEPEIPGVRTSLDAPIPTPAMAKRHSASWESISLGHSVYMRKCGECHLHLLPDQIASQDWRDHVTEMSEKSGISP